MSLISQIVLFWDARMPSGYGMDMCLLESDFDIFKIKIKLRA